MPAALIPHWYPSLSLELWLLAADCAYGQVVDMPGHNTSLFVLGVMILWFGWYGFNPGSQLALINNSDPVANAAVTTTIAPAIASMSALITNGAKNRRRLGAPAVQDASIPSDAYACRSVIASRLTLRKAMSACPYEQACARLYC